MCGIVAAFGTIWKKHEDAFKLMLMFDTIRGPHSTGVGSVLRNNMDNVTYLKSTGTPWNLFQDKEFPKLMARYHGMLLGHNRYATKGAVTSDNAHPFIHGSLMGVHNGTIWNQAALEDHKNFDVDSENIYYHMSKHGVENTVKTINGAFALVWYDKETKSINAVRNDQRPLYYVFTKDRHTIFFASESWMLHVALTKSEFEFESIHQVPVGKLHTVKMPEKYNVPLELEVKDVAFYSKPHYSYNNSTSNYSLKGNSNSATSKSGKVASISSAKFKKLLGEMVYFSISGVKKEGKARYILAELESDPNMTIKFFDNGDDDFWKKLIDSTSIFKGRIKSWSGHGNDYYLTVNRRTVEEISKEEFDKLQEESDKESDRQAKQLIAFRAKGFGGKDLNLQEWEFATERGCSLCGQVPMVIHADFLTWTGPRSFICPSCDEEYFEQQLI